MTRTLILLRHAKAAQHGRAGDASRELSGRGERQARALGPLLAAEVGAIDVALVSTAARAASTATLLREGVEVGERRDVPEIYQYAARGLLDLVRDTEGDPGVLLVVGHEPTISSLAAHLHDDRKDSLALQVSLGVPTATACVLDVPTTWSDLDARTAHLRALVRPSA
ncbi:SixA phosphatase family protein [Georgenia sp. Z1344]|uniref:SixA phosphatase family protein n=1 Tax=Georgenia sp. Z1344 TaxID=3416706 RepID=UPI003CF5C31A